MATTFESVPPIAKIDAKDVRLLWYVDFWDGPVNGVGICQQKKCWFEMMTDTDPDFDADRRRFLLFELSPEQWEDEEHWHEMFRQHVGTHCDFAEPHPVIRPKELHRAFYDAYQKRAKPDYSNNRILGWFELD